VTHDDASLGMLWATLYDNGTVTGIALLGLILIAIVLAAQFEAMFSACRHLLAHRRQLISAQQKMEADVRQALETVKAIDQSLPELRETIEALVQEYEKLDIEATAARKLHIREVVMSDIFIPPGDRPYLAQVSRPQATPDEPFAAQWRAGRDHVLYGTNKKAATIRFAQRYPTEHGFVVGPVSLFNIPWNPPEEQPTLDPA
jgi:FtsZ-binding cell division protein ZapB